MNSSAVDRDDLHAQLAARDSELSVAKKELARLREQVTEAARREAELVSKSHVEADVTNEQVQNLMREVEEYESRLQRALADRKRAEESAAAEHATLERMERELRSLRTDVQGKSDEIADLQQSETALKRQLDAAEGHRRRVQELEEAQKELKKELSVRIQTIRQLEDERAAAHEELSHTQSRMADLEIDNELLKDELNNAVGVTGNGASGGGKLIGGGDGDKKPVGATQLRFALNLGQTRDRADSFSAAENNTCLTARNLNAGVPLGLMGTAHQNPSMSFASAAGADFYGTGGGETPRRSLAGPTTSRAFHNNAGTGTDDFSKPLLQKEDHSDEDAMADDGEYSSRGRPRKGTASPSNGKDKQTKRATSDAATNTLERMRSDSTCHRCSSPDEDKKKKESSCPCVVS